MKEVNWKFLILSFVFVFGIAFIGSLFNFGVTDSAWYQNVRTELTPPNWVFPIVWNILFLLISISLYFILISKKKNKKIVLSFFGINLVLNALWSYLFFGLKNPTLSFFELILIWVTILGMIITSYKIDKKSSYLLIPYLVWVSFAGILNFVIFIRLI